MEEIIKEIQALTDSNDYYLKEIDEILHRIRLNQKETQQLLEDKKDEF